MSSPPSASPLHSVSPDIISFPSPPSPVADVNSTPPLLPQVAPFPSPSSPPPSVTNNYAPPPVVAQITPVASPPVVLPLANLAPPIPTSPLPPASLVSPIPTTSLTSPPPVKFPTLAPPPPVAAAASPPVAIFTPITPVSSPLSPEPPLPANSPPFPVIPSSPLLPPPGLHPPSQPGVSLPPIAASIPPLPPLLASPSAYSSPPAEILPAPTEPNYIPPAPFPLEQPIMPISPVKSPTLLPLANVNLPVHSEQSHLSTGLILGFTICGFLLLLSLGVAFISYKKRRRNQGKEEAFCMPPSLKPKGQFENGLKQGELIINVQTQSTSRESQSIASGSKNALPIQSPYGDLGLCSGTLSYDELVAATDGFSEANLIGEGGFGYVHKGVLHGGQEVAIKQLKEGSRQGEREFQAEVEIISRVHHKHLVSLKGYCISGARRLLVYEFVPNNTLEFHLHGNGQPILIWPTRLKIAIGSARGLAYLHEDCNPIIIHRDIKASNILLDHKFEAKVSDFGLAKSLCNARTRTTHISTQVVGTFGYLAPEYATSGKVTEKSDVYSYGVMLLELITGRPPIGGINSEIREALVIWARPLLTQALGDGNFEALIDPRLQNNYDTNEMVRMVACAAACVRHSAWLRPRMSLVARALEGDIPVGDLDEGTNPGHSNVYGFGFPSSLDISLDNSHNNISSYTGTTSEYILNLCTSSSNSSKEDDQQQTQG